MENEITFELVLILNNGNRVAEDKVSSSLRNFPNNYQSRIRTLKDSIRSSCPPGTHAIIKIYENGKIEAEI
jgi:hypothetical protein